MGLLSAEVLVALNEVYSGTYINERTPNEALEKLEQRLVDLLGNDLRVSEEAVRASPLIEWPLYHFTTVREDAA